MLVHNEDKKYTFATKAIQNSSADKMYRGGLPNSKKVFEFASIDFPKGYFSAVNSAETEDWLLNYSVTPNHNFSCDIVTLLINSF